ncbi:MAG: chemotaxis protein CheA [Candidatus Korobacteraceae bacterium]
MSIFSDDRANELRSIFFESSQEILQALNKDALLMERSPRDSEVIRDLRRSVHTLKGDSAACGYKGLSELAHAVEDVLTPEMAARDGEALAGLVMVCADLIDDLLSAYRNQVQPPDTTPVLALIESLRHPQHQAAFSPQFNWTEYELLQIARGAVPGQQIYNLALAIDPACPMRAAAVQLVRNVLKEAGVILVMRPGEDDAAIPDVIEVALSSNRDLDWVQRKSKIPTVISKVYAEAVSGTAVGPISAQSGAYNAPPEPPAEARQLPPSASPHEGGKAATEANSSQPVRLAIERPKGREERLPAATENVLRVETERVDAVLDLVGELIIAKSMMQELFTEINRALASPPPHARSADLMVFQAQILKKLQLASPHLRAKSADLMVLQSQILKKLQRAVMKIRMVPADQMFRRLPRVVRDAAKQLGREVDLIIEGESTDLDKSILDALAEPMMHLLRNAVDHGIEPPLERAAAGKSPTGTLHLNAYHQGNQVVMEISDDGRGIDSAKVVVAAVSRGIITAEQASRLSDSEALDLIFHPGLSTSGEITEISGRGIGMDVVKAVMDRLKGTIVVRSIAGNGTTIFLKVPLTLAIIKALLFRVSERLYAVPLANVLEILRSHEIEVHLVDGQEVLRIREEVVPLIRLSRIHAPAAGKLKLFVVVVSLGDRKVGLVVDHLVGEQELVIKALDESLVSTAMVSGASILGDGRVVLILSVSDVVEKLAGGYTRNIVEAEALRARP